MTQSRTRSRVARKSLTQQTFPFWEPVGDARPVRAAGTTCDLPKACLAKATTTSPTPAPFSRAGTSPTDNGRSLPPRADSAAAGPNELPGKAGGLLPVNADRHSLMADLRGRAAAISSSPALDSAEQFSTGSRVIDAWLPGGGLKRGWICEWVAGHDASGASTLAMLAAASTPHRGPIIVVDPLATFHAAGAIACGIAAQRIVICRPDNRADAVWTMDQALRCDCVAAVWAVLPWNLNDRDARRLQLAAERGRTPGLFVLQSSAKVRPSFAAVRLHVTSVAVNTSRLSAAARVASGLPLRPPMDLRVLRVSLERARGQRQNQAFLAIAPDARLHTLTAAAVAQMQTPEQRPAASAAHSVSPPAGSRHEAVAVPLAARLANPTSPHGRPEARPRRVG